MLRLVKAEAKEDPIVGISEMLRLIKAEAGEERISVLRVPIGSKISLAGNLLFLDLLTKVSDPSGIGEIRLVRRTRRMRRFPSGNLRICLLRDGDRFLIVHDRAGHPNHFQGRAFGEDDLDKTLPVCTP